MLIGIAEYEGSVESALNTASEMLNQAREDLEVLEPGEWRDGLSEITHYLEGLLNECRR